MMNPTTKTRTLELLRSEELARLHVTAELGGDVAEIMDTISNGDVFWVQFFSADGVVPDPLDPKVECRVMTSREEAERYYEAFVTELLDLDRVVHVRDLLTDWYSFFESFYYGRNLTNGQEVRGHHVVLIPTRPDGIAGEILWPKYLCGIPDPDTVATEIDGARVETAFDLVERALAAMRSNDSHGVAELFRPRAYLALPDLTGAPGSAVSCDSREQIEDYFERLFATFDVSGIKVLNRISDSWYVFVDMIVELEPRTRSAEALEIRTAQTFGIGVDGLLAGLVGC
jgi:hypothetical protein